MQHKYKKLGLHTNSNGHFSTNLTMEGKCIMCHRMTRVRVINGICPMCADIIHDQISSEEYSKINDETGDNL